MAEVNGCMLPYVAPRCALWFLDIPISASNRTWLMTFCTINRVRGQDSLRSSIATCSPNNKYSSLLSTFLNWIDLMRSIASCKMGAAEGASSAVSLRFLPLVVVGDLKSLVLGCFVGVTAAACFCCEVDA